MKTILEMNEDEILKLEEGDIKLLVKHKLAEKGIPLKDKPVELVLKEIPDPDLRLAHIPALSCLLFPEEAINKVLKFAIQELGNSGKKYNYGEGSCIYEDDSRYDSREITLSTKNIYSKDKYEEIIKDLVDNSKKTAKNEDLRNDYKDFIAEYSKIEDEINLIIEAIKSKHRRIELLKNKYKEYLEISENNAEIALKFLNKAYDIDTETLELVVGI